MVFNRGGLEIWERLETRNSEEGLKSASVEFNYIIRGSSNDVLVKNFLIAKSPTEYDGMSIESVSIKPMSVQTGGVDSWWEGTVKYTWAAKEKNDDEGWPLPTYSFDTSGGTFHISTSLMTIGSIPAPGTGNPPNFEGAIGVSKDKVQGVDIVLPKLGFSETHKFPVDTITGPFIKGLARATGRTNSDNFRTFKPGELLFLGATGQKSDTDVSVTYKFEASENMVDYKLGNVTIPRKDGHHYLWTHYTDQTDDSTGTTQNKLRAAYVEQIYDTCNFSQTLALPDHPTRKRRRRPLGGAGGFDKPAQPPPNPPAAGGGGGG